MLVGVGIIGTAVALTAVLCATSVITVATCIGVNLLVLAFYISTAALLTNHAAMETKGFESLTAQVMRFETDLQAIIQSFQVIEERLATLLHTVIVSDTDKVNEISSQLVGNAHELSETANLLKTINQTLTVYDSAFKAKLEALEEEIEVTTAEVEQPNQDEEEFQALFTQNQTFCQQVSHQLQQSAARNLVDQAFLAQFQTTATPQFPPSTMPQPR